MKKYKKLKRKEKLKLKKEFYKTFSGVLLIVSSITISFTGLMIAIFVNKKYSIIGFAIILLGGIILTLLEQPLLRKFLKDQDIEY